MHSRRPSDHGRHDRLLVARFAADDCYPGERRDAESLVAACSECAALAADIRVLSKSLGAVAAPAHRPRDFRLTPEDAQRLRGSWFERAMRSLAGPGFGALRPVAGVALSIGLALAVVGALPLGMASSPAPETPTIMQDRPERAAATAETSALEAPDMAPGAEPPPQDAAGDVPVSVDPLDEAYLEPSPASAMEADDIARQSGTDDAAASSGPSALVYAGVGLSAVALGVLVLVWLARRRFADPLLR